MIKKCPKGTRKNKITGLCDPIIKPYKSSSHISFDKLYKTIRNTYKKKNKIPLATILEKKIRNNLKLDTIEEYTSVKNLLPQILYIVKLQTVPDDNPIFTSLVQYTNCYYSSINSYLRKNTNLHLYKLNNKFLKTAIRNIDYIFSRIPPITNKLKVYRGLTFDINKDIELIENYQFVSTSLSYKIAESFPIDIVDPSKRKVIEIYIPKNSKIIPLYSLFYKHQEGVWNEFEILLDRRGSLKKINTPPSYPNIYAVYEYVPPDYTIDIKYDPDTMIDSFKHIYSKFIELFAISKNPIKQK
jgi:hypothetical protein